jgi:hypothetical protein
MLEPRTSHGPGPTCTGCSRYPWQRVWSSATPAGKHLLILQLFIREAMPPSLPNQKPSFIVGTLFRLLPPLTFKFRILSDLSGPATVRPIPHSSEA